MEFEDYDDIDGDFSDGFEDTEGSVNIDDPIKDDSSEGYPLDEWEEVAILGGMSEEISEEKKEQERLIREFEKDKDRSSNFDI